MYNNYAVLELHTPLYSARAQFFYHTQYTFYKIQNKTRKNIYVLSNLLIVCFVNKHIYLQKNRWVFFVLSEFKNKLIAFKQPFNHFIYYYLFISKIAYRQFVKIWREKKFNKTHWKSGNMLQILFLHLHTFKINFMIIINYNINILIYSYLW